MAAFGNEAGMQKFLINKAIQLKMLIDLDLLYSFGAQDEHYKNGDIIFEEGETPAFYYQIIDGRIKLNHYNEDGRELILAILHQGLSVCELLLFIDQKYPVNSVVLGSSHIIKLPKQKFLKMLDLHPEIAKTVNKFLAERLYQKFIMMENNSSLNPEVRIKGILDYYKSFGEKNEKFSFEVPLTRQQLASMTALRVETVIRTIKNIEKEKVVKIRNGKIYY